MSEELGGDVSERVIEGALHGFIIAIFTVIAEAVEHHKGVTALLGVLAAAFVYLFFKSRRRKRRNHLLGHHKHKKSIRKHYELRRKHELTSHKLEAGTRNCHKEHTSHGDGI